MTSRWRLAITGGSALFTALVMGLYLHQLESSYTERGEMVPVLLAARYIPAGTPLYRKHFCLTQIPKAYVAPGTVSSFEVLESSPHQARFRNALALPERTPLAQRDLTPVENKAAMSQRISPRHVAVSFAVNKARGVAGNLHPGDIVDLFHTPLNLEGSPMGKETSLLFQAVTLLAVDKRWQRDEDRPREALEFPEDNPEETVLTVQLNPIAALRLLQLRESAILSVALRAQGDDRVLGEVR